MSDHDSIDDGGIEYLGGVDKRGGRVWLVGIQKHRTAKAILVELFDGREVWLPTSQIDELHPPDENGERRIKVTDWIAKQNDIQ